MYERFLLSEDEQEKKVLERICNDDYYFDKISNTINNKDDNKKII